MRKSDSLEKLNLKSDVDSDVIHRKQSTHYPELTQLHPKRRRNVPSIKPRYQLVVKPRLHRSSSLSDLTPNPSDFALDFLQSTENLLYDKSGDTGIDYLQPATTTDQHMSWSFKGKKTKKKSATMYPEGMSMLPSGPRRESSSPRKTVHSTEEDISSFTSMEESRNKTGSSFPFTSTPSGNLKVQSNQVVYQSSTVGVILADPTQAKVKVKVEGKSPEELQEDTGKEDYKVNYQVLTAHTKLDRNKTRQKSPQRVRETSKDLHSLGYVAEPVDWDQVELPGKRDLAQELLRRIQNFVNTDTIVHIGDEDFHCHSMVLEIYTSTIFTNSTKQREIKLPISSVTPESFHTIYEWMYSSGTQSFKVLRRENILDLFVAAQYLGIKDLEEQCWSFIVNEKLFTEDSAFTLFRQAKKRGITSVVDLMVPRIMKFFLPLVASSDFLDLSLDELLILLKSNYICVTSEMEVLMSGIRWLHSRWTDRRQWSVDVARCVRFGLISPWQLVDIKRNPDNAQVLELVSQPEVQQMVDDGLAYVIIQYWYGNNSKNYYHWIEVLGLTEPAERNWIGEEMSHVTYADFLKYLDSFLLPKKQMYENMSTMEPVTRKQRENFPGSIIDSDNDGNKKERFDFPLPQTLKNYNDNNPDCATCVMGDLFEFKKKNVEEFFKPGKRAYRGSLERRDEQQNENLMAMGNTSTIEDSPSPLKVTEELKQQVFRMPCDFYSPTNNLYSSMCNEGPSTNKEDVDHKENEPTPKHEVPEKDSNVAMLTTNSDTSTGSSDSKARIAFVSKERRHSVAATFLAAATAHLARQSQVLQTPPVSKKLDTTKTDNTKRKGHVTEIHSPQISLFKENQEFTTKKEMNKLSISILGPTNKNFMMEGTLFNWERETVLVFGGIDPHTSYNTGRNTGKEIIRFDPVANTWDCVGDLPEPRHHHAIAFMRGRVYLVGGADPRDDDVRGKSVVVSTVWSFEPVTKSWFSENGLAIPRKNFGLVVHRMALYAIGGQDKKGRVLRSVEKFDPKTGSWTEMRPMSVARMAVASTKYRDYIWVAGGMTGEKNRPLCKVVECYNSKTNEWTEIHNLRFPRCFATLFSMNDVLFLVGGAGKISDKDKSASSVGAIDEWDWSTRQWKEHTELSIPRHGHALAYLGTQLIIIGGVTTIYMRALNNVESYCCERGAWIRGVSPLPTPLSGHGAVTLPPASLM